MNSKKASLSATRHDVSLVRSSAAESLTLVAASKDNKAFLHASVGLGWTAVSPTFAFALAAGFMLAGTLAILRVRD